MTNIRVRHAGLVASVLAAAFAAAPSQADEWSDPLASLTVPTDIDSGWLSASGPRVELVYATVVTVPDVAWIRLDLAGTLLRGDVSMGSGAYLRLSSLLDGAEQILDDRSLAEWGSTSAYFNGDAVLVQLFAGPSARSRVQVPNATVSAEQGGIASICGPVDNRIASDDPREGRMLPVGCTGWLFDGHAYSIMTAGHCLAGTTVNVVEFNVPPSLGNGALQHPPPSDQYAIDPTSKQYTFGAIGNDWGYFGVFKNSTTFLSPLIAQGDSVPTAIPGSNGTTARVTGYGTDSGTANQTNQTSTGPFTSFTGTTLKYQVDTTGGNSGSPVLRESDGKAIGIHTNAGCNSGGGANSGTGLNNAGLQNALASPTGICLTNPPSCGMSSAGNCFAAHAGAACDDATCCQTVCAVDPFCCNSAWDADCANEAASMCEGAPCGGGCVGDLDDDGTVGAADLAIVLAAWGGGGCADLDHNGVVDAADLSMVLAAWGSCG